VGGRGNAFLGKGENFGGGQLLFNGGRNLKLESLRQGELYVPRNFGGRKNL